jgi:uncharacterized protein (DUF58 family)
MIPPHLLRELRYVEISAAKASRSARIGPHTSRARGTGFDFDQHLAYRAGDDVRRIDWNATARLNTPYVRQMHAERELDVVMAVDLSRSMDIGARRYSKKEVMTLVAASVLFSASADHISAGFLPFSDRVLGWTPPRRAPGRAWHVLEDIWAMEPGASRTSVMPAIRHLLSSLRTMSIVAIVSDFVTDENVFESAELRMLAARHDVIAVVIDDPADTALPPGRGFIRVRDVETGARMVVALDDRTRRAYAGTIARRRRAIADACYRLGVDFVFVRTDAPAMVEPVIELFARRRHA